MTRPTDAATMPTITPLLYWAALIADGGESRCGWLKDKFGLSWQVVPRVLVQLLRHHDREKAGRVQQAMLGMMKLDIAGLQDA